jgi:hypothetical protein
VGRMVLVFWCLRERPIYNVGASLNGVVRKMRCKRTSCSLGLTNSYERGKLYICVERESGGDPCNTYSSLIETYRQRINDIAKVITAQEVFHRIIPEGSAKVYVRSRLAHRKELLETVLNMINMAADTAAELVESKSNVAKELKERLP